MIELELCKKYNNTILLVFALKDALYIKKHINYDLSISQSHPFDKYDWIASLLQGNCQYHLASYETLKTNTCTVLCESNIMNLCCFQCTKQDRCPNVKSFCKAH